MQVILQVVGHAGPAVPVVDGEESELRVTLEVRKRSTSEIRNKFIKQNSFLFTSEIGIKFMKQNIYFVFNSGFKFIPLREEHVSEERSVIILLIEMNRLSKI